MTSYARNLVPVNIASGSHSHYPDNQHNHSQRRHKFVADLSQCLLDFVIQLLPTVEELAVKEDVRKLLERLIRTIEPDSRLLSFGSTANGFSLRNSDMDLCCLIDSEERLAASDLVTMVGDLLERETKFHVKPLPHARIPIVKLSLDSSPGLPLGIACDIGFENRLALENTRLLLCYSMVDPTRVRTLVLFLKVWSKRRKINSPYQGTLSSYGYVLLVIYFLVHVKNPPVLPNLQQIPPLHPIPPEEHHMGNRNIWFFDDIELLRQRWKSSNTESVAELLIDFFRYYAKDFTYNSGVASIRAGLLKKDSKGWQSDADPRFRDGRERNRLCIEDPFELDYNVARCVTRDGLYVIRGEFMRASRILQVRQERGYYALAQLCEERDESQVKLTAAHNTIYIPPRLSFPPQTPYSVGSNSFRPNGTPARDRLSPPRKELEENAPPNIPPHVRARSPPEHMAPKRSKYTSPPPPEAPNGDLVSFESRLGIGLSLATAATDAREQERAYMSSSSNSEILSDDGDVPSDVAQEDDDVKSVQSFTGEPSAARSRPEEIGPSSFIPSSVPPRISSGQLLMAYQQAKVRTQEDTTPTPYTNPHYNRGRRSGRAANDSGQAMPPVSYHMQPNDFHHPNTAGKSDGLRRSNSGPARANHAPRMTLPAAARQMPFNVPLPPSPVHTSTAPSPTAPTVYYETNAQRMGNSNFSSSPTASPVNPLALYQQQYYIAQSHAQAQTQAHGLSQRAIESSRPFIGGGPTSERHAAKPQVEIQQQLATRPIHSHTHSSSTIVGPPTPAASSFTMNQLHASSGNNSQQSSPSHSPSPNHTGFPRLPLALASQTTDVSPSPPHPAMTSSYRTVPASPQHASSPRHTSPHLSPHLSSRLPHLTRRQSQTHGQAHSLMQPPVHSPPVILGLGVPNSIDAQFSFDLASPSVSPESSDGSRDGSNSGSAGSPGSLSPVSSTSPRTADLSSPHAPSPDRRPYKHERAMDQQRLHREQSANKFSSHERDRQMFSFDLNQNRYYQRPVNQTNIQRGTGIANADEHIERKPEDGPRPIKGLPSAFLSATSEKRLPPVIMPDSSSRTSGMRQTADTDWNNKGGSESSHLNTMTKVEHRGEPGLTSQSPGLCRIEEARSESSSTHENGPTAEDWERVSLAIARLQL